MRHPGHRPLQLLLPAPDGRGPSRPAGGRRPPRHPDTGRAPRVGRYLRRSKDHRRAPRGALAHLGLHSSAGCAGNRMLAAMACALTPPDRRAIIDDSPEAITAFLSRRPVREPPGVGTKFSELPSIACQSVAAGKRVTTARSSIPLPKPFVVSAPLTASASRGICPSGPAPPRYAWRRRSTGLRSGPLPQLANRPWRQGRSAIGLRRRRPACRTGSCLPTGPVAAPARCRWRSPVVRGLARLAGGSSRRGGGRSGGAAGETAGPTLRWRRPS